MTKPGDTLRDAVARTEDRIFQIVTTLFGEVVSRDEVRLVPHRDPRKGDFFCDVSAKIAGRTGIALGVVNALIDHVYHISNH